MALSANKTWLAGEILTAADLNDEFSNLYNNGLLLVFPATGAVDFNAKELILDGDTSIQSDVADQIDFRTGGTDTFAMSEPKTSSSTTSSARALGGSATRRPMRGRSGQPGRLSRVTKSGASSS